MYLVSGLFDAKQKLTKEETEDPQRLKFSHSSTELMDWDHLMSVYSFSCFDFTTVAAI